jgi:hypothetical protein
MVVTTNREKSKEASQGCARKPWAGYVRVQVEA